MRSIGTELAAGWLLPTSPVTKHDQPVKPDILAGLGFLAVSLVTLVIEAVLIANRHRLARWLVEEWVAAAAQASPKWRWLHGSFASDAWHDEEFRERALVWVWLPPVLFVPVVTAVFILGAVNAFRA